MKPREHLIRMIVLIFCAQFPGAWTAASAKNLKPDSKWTLDQVLSRMDRRGEHFRAMKAHIAQRRWTAVLQEFDEGEEGEISFLRSGQRFYLRKDINKPQKNFLVIRDGEVLFYQPRIKQAQRYQLGKNKDKAEFLLLGFGTDKAAIKEAYNTRLIGQERIEGKDTVTLELTPKSAKVSAFFSKILLWIDTTTWVPVQQRLVEPTNDYLQIQFSKIKLNPRLKTSDFELHLPKDVKVIGG